MRDFSNTDVASMLREVAAAYTLQKGNIFQIRAYDNAATSIEQLTSEVEDLWEDDKLDQIPGVGESIQGHLDELFKTGKVKHWEEIKAGLPEATFKFLDIPGVGPKTALKLAVMGVKSIEDLRGKLESGFLVRKGLSEKLAQKVLGGLEGMEKAVSGRMMLPYAYIQAEKVLEYLRDNPAVEHANALGSLRRMVATVGDLDFAVTSEKPMEAVEYIIRMPGVKEVVDKGEAKVTLRLTSGLHLDFLITHPNSYGALLQHFTGSKSHNIHLRTLAERKGLSLSEYGVKKLKTQNSNVKTTTQNSKMIRTSTEKEFYKLLGMEVPPPEIREDTGEIELALRHKLPDLVELKDIKGDLHIHDNFPIEPSHDLGNSSITEIAREAGRLGYEYFGISDHSPSISNHTDKEIVGLIKQYCEAIEQYNSSHKSTRVLKLLEVDIQPDGSLSVPEEGLKLLDFAIASVHSLHSMSREEMTKRLLKALGNPYVKVLGHPTNRLINRRGSSEVDWEAIFKFAAANNKAMEINAYPDRLDLPDTLVRVAKELGVKFVINTDSHIATDMTLMKFGVAVARRGWLSKEDVVNSWQYNKFAKWFRL